MKRSDIGIVAIIYAICLFFFIMTIRLPEDAQTYPLCLIIGLFVLNTLYIGRALLVWCKNKVMIDDWHEQFGNFRAGQFFGSIALGIGFMVGMWLIGFYISCIAYLFLGMAFLRVPKRHILITSVVMIALVYAVFTLFLKVPLPVGILFK